MTNSVSLQSVSIELEDIKTTINNNDGVCLICSITLSQEDSVRLQCKHEYHYECIRSWYKKIMENINSATSNKIRECPYCRKPGGYLPLIQGKNYEKDIHSPKIVRTSKVKKYSQCQGVTKMGLQCKHKGTYNGYCFIHNK